MPDPDDPRGEPPAALPPSRPRLPRQRDAAPRRARPTEAASSPPAKPARGFTGPLRAIAFGAGAVAAVLALVIVKTNRDPGRGPTGNTWNSPPTTQRLAPLDDLLEQARRRAAKELGEVRLAGLAARHIRPDGQVDLNYGSAQFELSRDAPLPPDPAGRPGWCSVTLSVNWHNWTVRRDHDCAAPHAPRCAAGDAIRRGLGASVADAELRFGTLAAEVADTVSGGPPPNVADGWVMRATPTQRSVFVADDCVAAAP